MKIETATIRRLRDALLQSGRRPSTVMSSAYETLTRQGMLTPQESTALTRVDPMAETMFLMMAADGKVAEAERDAVRGAIRGLTDNLLRSGTIKVMIEVYEQGLKSKDASHGCRRSRRPWRRKPHEAEGAFSLAAAVALADDEVHDEENSLINQLAHWFGISQERADQILDQLEEDRHAPAQKE